MPEITVDKYYLENLKYRIEKLERKNSELKKELDKVSEEKNYAEFRIKNELEPRIKQEKIRYDFWVSQQTGEAECDHFCSTLDDLSDFIEEHSKFFEWEDANGDLYEKILYLIKNKEDDNIYYIEERD